MQSVRVKYQKAKAYLLFTIMSILHLSSHTTKITGLCYIYGQHFESMLVGNLWVTETEEESNGRFFARDKDNKTQ